MENGRNKFVLFLSTYPPRACGIATFTQDLVQELKKKETIKVGIVAINDTGYHYPKDVLYKVRQESVDSYRAAAAWINNSGADLLVIEHEYGIYGGKSGKYLLALVHNLRIPFDITLHTVLPEPDGRQKRIMQTLAAKCCRLVTMCPCTVSMLQHIYHAAPGKITVIHHGVPEIPVENRDAAKDEKKMSGRFIVSTFGLLSPGKGLEYGIKAIAEVAQSHPEILYLILGRTHPVVQKKYGEQYRRKLEQLVKTYGIENNVQFINKYLSKEELIRYLSLSDIYMTPYLGKDQAVSGTLAYAVGYGRVIVSTPYIYARSMLADGRGLLAKFRSAQSLADCITQVIGHPDKQAEMEQRTIALGKQMRWTNVAEKYLKLFSDSTCQETRR